MKKNRALGRRSSPKSCSNARSTIIFNVAWQHHTFNFYVEKMCDRELQMPCLLFLNGYFLIKQSARKNEILDGWAADISPPLIFAMPIAADLTRRAVQYRVLMRKYQEFSIYGNVLRGGTDVTYRARGIASFDYSPTKSSRARARVCYSFVSDLVFLTNVNFCVDAKIFRPREARCVLSEREKERKGGRRGLNF